jgi:hypothetical protein
MPTWHHLNRKMQRPRPSLQARYAGEILLIKIVSVLKKYLYQLGISVPK